MIQIEQLDFAYPDHRFSLCIDQWQVELGQQVAIVGPSGSGKTTLLHLIAGILKPAKGKITLDQFCVSQASDRQRRNFRANHIGMVFQQFELVDYLNVRQNILLPFMINSSLRKTEATEAHLQELVQRTGIEKLQRASVGNLSQGERQRVAICRALIATPKLIMADEPTGNLDPENKHLIVDLLREQASEIGATLLMVTHDTALVDSFPTSVDFQNWRSKSGASTAPLLQENRQ